MQKLRQVANAEKTKARYNSDLASTVQRSIYLCANHTHFKNKHFLNFKYQKNIKKKAENHNSQWTAV